MQEQDNNAVNDLSRRGLLMGTAAGGLLIAGSGAMLAPSANAATVKLKKGGVLRVAVGEGGANDTQDAHLGGFTGDTARAYQLYDRLVVRDSKFKIVNELADSFTPNKTGKIWTVRVKKGVKFHNGRTLTADDVIFTIQRILDPATRAIRASQLANVDAARLKKVDEYTVSITLKTADVTFDEQFSDYAMGIVPVGYNPASPVGTGPFKASSFTPGVKSVYTKNTSYWRTGEPYVDSVEIYVVTDESARVNGLISGQFDCITDLPTAQISTIKANKKLAILNAKTGSYVPIAMNTKKTPFQDKRVRQAMRLLVDREAIVKNVYGGYATLGNDIIGRYDEAYDTSLFPQREYDPKKAKSLLKAAGVTNLALEINYTDGPTGMAEIPLAFKTSAKQAGVEFSAKKNGGEFWDNFLGGYTIHMDYYLNRTYLQGASTVYKGGSYAMETGWSNAKYNALIAEAKTTASKSLRNEIIQDAMKIEYDEGAYIITSFYNKFDGLSAEISGFGSGHPSGNALNNFTLRSVGFKA
jgi:peptide/nickel transport system substrate-binding protein